MKKLLGAVAVISLFAIPAMAQQMATLTITGTTVGSIPQHGIVTEQKPNALTIQCGSITGGSPATTCSSSAPVGTIVNVYPSAQDGYKLAGWKVSTDSYLCGDITKNCTFKLTGNTTIVAIFAPARGNYQ
jgi:hypothetical protein